MTGKTANRSGAECLSIALGWAEVIGCLLLGYPVFQLLRYRMVVGDLDVEQLLGGTLPPNLSSYENYLFVVLCLIHLFFIVLSFCTATILLLGIYVKNTKLIFAWIVYTGITSVFRTVIIGVQAYSIALLVQAPPRPLPVIMPIVLGISYFAGQAVF